MSILACEGCYGDYVAFRSILGSAVVDTTGGVKNWLGVGLYESLQTHVMLVQGIITKGEPLRA